jgi:hypothetical protein
MKINLYFLLLLLCISPSVPLKAHSWEPSAPTLKEIEMAERENAPSAPALDTEGFSEADTEEAIRRSLAEQKEERFQPKHILVGLTALLIMCLIFVGRNSNSVPKSK